MTKNILITGATSALAKSFIELAASKKNNYKILAVSRSNKLDVNKETFLEFQHISGIDLTNENNLQTLKHKADNYFNERFNVIHFAGDFWRHKPLICTKFSEICSMINSHYISLCGVAQVITPLLMKYGGGRLVAFSCNSVSYNYPDMSPFTSAKAAVEAFIKCYANETAPYGIAATSIALPTMRTDEILIEKPNGDHANYIAPSSLASFLLEYVLAQPTIATGNVIRLINHSPTFYGQGYFNRNPRHDEHEQMLQHLSC